MNIPPQRLYAEGDGGAGGGAGGGDAAAQAAAAAAAAAKGGGGAGGGDDAAARAAAEAAAAAAKPKPFFVGLYDAEGKIDKTALDRLPDALKAHKDTFAKYDTVEALLNGFGNAHSLASKKALLPLPANASPEVIAERKAHLDQLNNVPKDPKGYGIARPQDLPEQFWSQEGADKFAALAQKHSISPAAVKELLGLQLELTQGELAKGAAAETAFYTKQDQDFALAVQKNGMDLDKAADLAIRGAKGLGLDPGSPIFKNAQVRMVALRAAELISEEKLITGDAAAAAGAAGNELAQARDIMQNPQNPLYKAWHDPTDPQHEAAKDRQNALYQLYGERTTKRGGG